MCDGYLHSRLKEMIPFMCKFIFQFSEGNQEKADTIITDKIYFDVAIADQNIGRIVIGLFGRTAPKTVKNFVQLSQGTVANKDGFRGSVFHRVIKNFMIQGKSRRVVKIQNQNNEVLAKK